VLEEMWLLQRVGGRGRGPSARSAAQLSPIALLLGRVSTLAPPIAIAAHV